MKRNYRSLGIILQVRHSGEKNRFLKILTPDHGIVGAVAYGAASPRSKLRSTTQSFYCGEILFYENPVKQFNKVISIDLHREFSNLRSDIKKLYAASLMAELLLAVYAGTQGDSRAYELCYDYLNNLYEDGAGRALRFANIALWRLLEIIGEQPDVSRDVKTARPFSGNATVSYLHSESGFMVQPGDLPAPSRNYCLHSAGRMFLLNQPRRNMAENARIVLPDGADRQLFTLLCSLYEYSIGQPIRTLSAGLLS